MEIYMYLLALDFGTLDLGTLALGYLVRTKLR